MTQPLSPQPAAPAGGAGVLMHPPYDFITVPGPPEYQVPAAYRRPYGQLVGDKRGRGYYSGVMALTSGVVSALVALMGGVLALIALIPASGALILGIRALVLRSRYPRTVSSGQTAGLAWGGIAIGLVCLPLAIGMFWMNSWLLHEAESLNCQYIYAGDEEAIQRCVDENTQ
ncbi:hypothetical protein [Rothia nasisuis]|uniref:hypothetical protein n=1 Tax=Rothia nasisuis TaxID=2109647 RepID=UPI001F287727|nr:hypothetical protein [Rothia nasisuis]